LKLRKKKQQNTKEGRKDGEYLITYTRFLEEKIGTLQSEKHLLEGEVLRLEQELRSLKRGEEGNIVAKIRNKKDANLKGSKFHEEIEPIRILYKWYEIHSRKADQGLIPSIKIGKKKKKKKKYVFKIVVLGRPEKTTFIQKCLRGEFADDIEMTTGADFGVKKMEVDGIHITLRIWDMAGTDRFIFIIPEYIKDTNGVIIICDEMDAKGFNRLSKYIEIVWDNVGDIPIFFCNPRFTLKAEQHVNPNEKYKITEITSEIGPIGKHAFELLTKRIIEQFK
jgi:small GTP-binding protein